MNIIKGFFIITVFTFTVSVPQYNINGDIYGGYSPYETCSEMKQDALSGFSSGPGFLYAHGGGLNKCGCHFNRKTGECHCHQDKGCGCECEPARCK